MSCACHRDPKLKDRSEWCDFCLCRHCGGKNLPRERGAAGSGRDAATADFSPDLFLLGATLGCAVGACVYAGEGRLYRHLYLMGMVAAAHVVRDAMLVMTRFLAAYVNP